MTTCPLDGCNGTTSLRYRLDRFDVRTCERCGILFRDPFPGDDEIRAMYEDPLYHASEYFAPVDDRPASGPEARIHEQALTWLDESRPCGATRSSRLLDIGCGNGVFLARARTHGWEVDGVEMSRSLSERCLRETGVAPRCGDYLQLEPTPATYDAICMWDFLEHTCKPEAVLEHAMRELRPEGRILIFTIDSDSLFNLLAHFLYRVGFGRFRRGIELLYDARHNYYFSQETLAKILKKKGLSTDHKASYRAHLGRWLAEPVPAFVKLSGDIVDAASGLVGRRYRQLLICRRQET